MKINGRGEESNKSPQKVYRMTQFCKDIKIAVGILYEKEIAGKDMITAVTCTALNINIYKN